MTTPVNSVFEYWALPIEEAAQLRTMAGRVRHSARTTVEAIFTIGTELLSAKALLNHGQFSDWVLTECGFSPRTAERFMRVVEVLGAQCDTVSFLQPQTLYQLTAKSTPKKLLQTVIEHLSSHRQASDGDVRALIGRSKNPPRPSAKYLGLAEAWEAASIREREELVAKDPEAHLALAWTLTSQKSQTQFAREHWAEFGPSRHPDTTTVGNFKNAPSKLTLQGPSGSTPAPSTVAIMGTSGQDFDNGIPDFLRRSKQENIHEEV